MLSEKGFNEYDNKLFEHLLHNKKPCSFVRTMCDNQLGEEDDVSSLSRSIENRIGRSEVNLNDCRSFHSKLIGKLCCEMIFNQFK